MKCVQSADPIGLSSSATATHRAASSTTGTGATGAATPGPCSPSRRAGSDYPILAFLVLNALDVLTTLWGLGRGLQEISPSYGLLFGYYGWSGVLGFKTFIVLGLVALALLFGHRHPPFRRILWVGSGMLAVAVIGNLVQGVIA